MSIYEFCLIGLRLVNDKHFSSVRSTGLYKGVVFLFPLEGVKLFPEVTQTVITAIDQLRLLHVDYSSLAVPLGD
ncbi:hypothetical protein DTH24_15185 [Salmonella enterica subsp. enterica serovar Urbana]|nr:hypothetical protein [Salmonella enterica]EBX8422400.1 hypothetical protein [Salmonella enterica subsp. enterica serovar Urbana]ECE9304364.1 hypothetical protein [Salmonella enterica subsp. enterica serovar Enteritidis]